MNLNAVPNYYNELWKENCKKAFSKLTFTVINNMTHFLFQNLFLQKSNTMLLMEALSEEKYFIFYVNSRTWTSNGGLCKFEIWNILIGAGLGGELFVTIGSHVTLDCVFSRKKGTPEWSWSINNSSQDFMTGIMV